MAGQLALGVITMDIGLPDMSGLEVTCRLRMELPRVGVVVTVHDEREYGEEALKAGAAHRGVMPGSGVAVAPAACGPGEVISEAGMFLSR